MHTVVALLPLAILFLLMVVWEKPAYIAAPITLAATIFPVIFGWGMEGV